MLLVPIALSFLQGIGAQEPVPSGSQPAESREQLDQGFDRAVVEWVRNAQELGHGVELPPLPSADFWERYRALAERGDERALLWLLRYVPEGRQAEVPALFERVRAAGDAAWVAEAIPLLVVWRGKVELGTYLESFDRPEAPAAHRIAALLGRAEASAGEDPAAAMRLRQRALSLDLRGADLSVDESLSAPEAEELFAAAQERLEGEQEAWFEAAVREVDGVSWVMPTAPQSPEDRWRSRIETLAEVGSARARMWVLENASWQLSEQEQAALIAHLDALVRDGIPAETARDFSRDIGSLVYKLGLEAVEPRARKLAEGLAEEHRGWLLLGLGEALCANAGDDPASRERGLGLLREVQQHWPESDAGQRAAGKVYRFENLVVGKVAPDFEAEDVEGTPFKLSDYRGKVTVVDFWGFW